MEQKENRIAFDFDGTLDNYFTGAPNLIQKQTRDYVRRLMKRGYEIFIVTRRFGPELADFVQPNEHEKVYAVAEELGIKKENVFFTNRKWKYEKLDELNVCMHIDDDPEECFHINTNTPNIKTILLTDDNWEEQLIQTISKHNGLSIWIDGNWNLINILVFLFIITFFTFLLFA